MNINAIVPGRSRAKKIYSSLKMAAVRQCVQSYVIDIQRRFERGNHNADSLDYIVFRLDWVINLLVRYASTEGIDPRVIDLLREVKK